MIRKVVCPGCGQHIEFDADDFQPGEVYPCPTCEADFAPASAEAVAVGPTGASADATGAGPTRALTPAGLELLQLCRRVSADGVLTGDEIWVLAEWLNAHPEATKEWPGEVLAAPIAEAFRDGELQPEELQALAAVLAGIERASGQAQEPVRLAAGPAAPAGPAASTEAGAPVEVLPFPHRTQIHADVGDAVYDVDLEAQTCTCPDWAERRAALPFKDPGRCCKHVVRAIFEAGLMDKLDPAVGAILLECLFRGGGTVPGARYTRVRSGNEHGVISLVEGPWVNVLTRSGPDWDKHAFNCEERRWSYGAVPEGWAKVLRGLLDRRES